MSREGIFKSLRENFMIKRVLAVAALFWSVSAMAAVDVNKATEAELDGVKGLGPSTTQLILSERKKSEFKDWNDLISRAKGIGEARAAKLSAQGLTVGGAAFKPASTSSGKAQGEKQPMKTAKSVEEKKGEKK